MNVAKLGKPYHNSCVHNHTHCCFIFQSALLDLFLTTNWMTHLITTSEKTHCAATKYLVELKMKVQFVGFLGGGLAFFFFFLFCSLHLYKQPRAEPTHAGIQLVAFDSQQRRGCRAFIATCLPFWSVSSSYFSVFLLQSICSY